MPRIFISYRRDDAAYVAAMLTRRLRSQFGDDSVFIDIDTIPFGIDFREQITRAVDKCDVLLAIIGNRWLGANAEKSGRRIDDPADFVRIEIEAAVRRAIPVVPILIDNATMPPADQLPESLAPLAFRNAAELRAGRDMEHHLDLIISGLRAHLSADDSGKNSESEVRRVRPSDNACLRFVRDNNWSGSALALRVQIDGVVVGKLSVGETLECSVSAGSHQLEVIHPTALRDAREQINISPGQTCAWSISFGLIGVKLTRI